MLSLQREDGYRQTGNRIRITTKDRKDVPNCLVVFFCLIGKVALRGARIAYGNSWNVAVFRQRFL